MEIAVNYSYELNLNSSQRHRLSQTAGAVRYVWNLFVAKQIEIKKERDRIYRENKERSEHGLTLLEQPRYLTFSEMSRELTALKRKPETQWLKEPIAQALQQALGNLSHAVGMSFKVHHGFPQFHSRDRGDSFRLPQPKPGDVDEVNGRIFVPKIGFLRYRKSRCLPKGEIRQITIKRDCSRWFVVITVFVKDFQPDETKAGELGLDFGIAQTVTLSDGRVFSLDTESIKKLEKEISHLQKRVSHNQEARKKLAKQGKAEVFDRHKPSRLRRQLQDKIRRKFYRIRCIRDDFCKKTANAIARTAGMVYVEDLRIKNMTASAKGTQDAPGKNVKQKAGLNRSMLRFAPSYFLQCLDWALTKHGQYMGRVHPAYTSQTCSVCGHCASENRQTQSLFLCVRCGHTENADLNAAKNILNRGRTDPQSSPSKPLVQGQQREPAKSAVTLA